MSLRQVCLELAREYGYNPMTVRRYLDHSLMERQRASDRVSHNRRYARRKHERRYNRNYHRLTRPRSQARLLAEVFRHCQDDTLTLEQITTVVRSHLEGVPFQPSTVEKRFLRPYMKGQRSGRIRRPPYLIRAASGYRLQDELLWTGTPNRTVTARNP